MLNSPDSTSESNFIQLRRKENKQTSDLMSSDFDAEAANSLLKTRILNPNILKLAIDLITGNNNKK